MKNITVSNITVSLDDETYRRARLWAAERGISVTAIVKCILTSLPNHRPAKGAQPPRSAAPTVGPKKRAVS